MRPAGFAGAVGLVLVMVLAASAASAHAYTFGTPLVQPTGPEQIKFDWTTQKCENEDIPDMPARAFRDDQGRVQMIANHYKTRRDIGPDLNNLQHECTVRFVRHNEADPAKYNDVEWVYSPYTLDGHTIYALIHNEYQGWAHGTTWCPYNWSSPFEDRAKCWLNSITFATSTDSGGTYTHLPAPQHLIATMPDRYDRTAGMTGMFDPGNIVEKDGWYYSLFWAAEPGSVQRGVCMMRTQTLADHKSWRAWDGEAFDNRFINPYTETYTSRADHTCKQIPQEQIGIMPQSLTWNTYYDKWMLVGNSVIDFTVPGFYFALSDDLIHWTERRLLMNAEVPWTYQCGDQNPVRDSALLDPTSTSRNFETAGRNPYLYFKRWNSYCSQSLDRDLVRIPIELSGSPPTAAFTLSANPARVGQWVTFNASASADSNGSIVKYEWDLDDDGVFEWNAGSDPTVDQRIATTMNTNVALRVTDSEGLQDIHVLRFTTYGPFMAWTGGETISPSGGDALEPDIAASAPEGWALSIWRRYDGTSPGPGPSQCCSRIQIAERKPDGNYGPVGTISPAGQNAFTPALAVDQTGGAVAAWTLDDGQNTRIQAATRPAPGQDFGPPQTLSQAASDAFDPRVASNAQGQAVAAWVRTVAGKGRIEAAVRPPGGSFGASQTLSYAHLDASAPEVEVEPNANTAVVWRSQEGAASAVQSASLLDLPTQPGYPRPAAAAKLRVALALAYQRCDSPNRFHGPGLEAGSCNPPQPTSAQLTSGTTDANDTLAQAVGVVRYSVVCSPPAPNPIPPCADPGDQSDVALELSLTDVRRQGPLLADYAGELEAKTTIRVTDRASGSLESESATVTDLPLSFTAPCTPTVSEAIGSSCAVTTHADAITPGTIVEGKRSIWALGTVRVFDGGADGLVQTADNTLFAGQGIFVP